MKSLSKLQTYAYICFLAVCVVCGPMQAWAAGSCVTNMVAGNIVAAWQAADSNGNTIVEGAIGTISTDPSTWMITTLSSSISQVGNGAPVLFSNSNGDVVVLWEYADTNSDNWLAASMLPFGATTWNTATISTSTEQAQFLDQRASLDNDGNVFITYTSYNSNFVPQIRGVTAAMGTDTSYSAPFNVSQYPL